MCHNERKIQEYFAGKKMTRAAHPVYSPFLSPCDFWLFGYAKEELKDQLITDESDLENKLTDIWEHFVQTFFNQSPLNGWKDWSGSSSMREMIISIRIN
jgi:hypothetical protein